MKRKSVVLFALSAAPQWLKLGARDVILSKDFDVNKE
jgi:hypothetical protein